MGMCCSNCFDDEILEREIEENGVVGDCEYCQSRQVICIDASALQEKFLRFLDVYEETRSGTHFHPEECIMDYGQFLHELIQEDWHIFSGKIEDNGEYAELTKDIFSDYCLHPDIRLDMENEYFSRFNTGMDQYTVQEQWGEFCDSIKNKNRFFSNHFINKQDMRELLSQRVFVGKASEKLYRARNGGEKNRKGELKAYPSSKMSAPTPEKTGNGRANPKGIAYLYLATSLDTAIAEMRPVKNANISVAKAALLADLKLVDFSGRVAFPSPFEVEDLKEEWERRPLMYQIGESFSMPIEPSLSDIEYVPTQFISEYIKNLGYDGFVFQSSLGPGLNYVLFDPGKAKISEADLYTISEIEYKAEKSR